jgi:hypothetical protein
MEGLKMRYGQLEFDHRNCVITAEKNLRRAVREAVTVAMKEAGVKTHAAREIMRTLERELGF